MKNIIVSLLITSILTFPAISKAEAQPKEPSRNEVMVQVSGVLYLREMSKRCPFPKDLADSFEIIAMVFVPSLPQLSQEELETVASRNEKRINNEFSSSKEESCQRAQKTFEGFLSSLESRKP